MSSLARGRHRPRSARWCPSTGRPAQTAPSRRRTLSTSLNLLQTLTTEAEAANGSNALNVTSALGLTVPGLTISNVQLVLDQSQVPQVAYGPTGTAASTSQVTADLQMNLSVAGRVARSPQRPLVVGKRDGDAELPQLPGQRTLHHQDQRHDFGGERRRHPRWSAPRFVHDQRREQRLRDLQLPRRTADRDHRPERDEPEIGRVERPDLHVQRHAQPPSSAPSSHQYSRVPWRPSCRPRA